MTNQRILFVCTGNICRSPTAEGVFRKRVNEHNLENKIEVDSAGTGGWHIGSPPDKRAQLYARHRGVDLSDLRARQVVDTDLEYYDLIIGMDKDHQQRLLALANSQQQQKIQLLLQYSDKFDEIEIPDPYYGGDSGFDLALDMIEDACDQLLKSLL